MRKMTVKEVETLLNEGKKLNIIDVREVTEVAAGKIPDAVNIPLGLIEFRCMNWTKQKNILSYAGQEAEAVVIRNSWKAMDLT